MRRRLKTAPEVETTTSNDYYNKASKQARNRSYGNRKKNKDARPDARYVAEQRRISRKKLRQRLDSMASILSEVKTSKPLVCVGMCVAPTRRISAARRT